MLPSLQRGGASLQDGSHGRAKSSRAAGVGPRGTLETPDSSGGSFPEQKEIVVTFVMLVACEVCGPSDGPGLC